MPKAKKRKRTTLRVKKRAIAKKCGVANSQIPANRSGCIREGVKIGERFEMNADFTNDATTECKCCEFRQHVKGAFKIKPPGNANWTTLQHKLRHGVLLSETVYNEDGFPNGDAYGYRAFNGCTDRFIPLPRTTGCQYRGSDFPGFSNLTAGTQYSMDLTFRGRIVDTCDNEKVIVEKTWTVKCSGTA